MSLVGSVVILLLTWAHVLCLLLRCALFVLVVSWICPTGWLGSPVFVCRTTHYIIVDYTMANTYVEWPTSVAFDGIYCMWPSHDTSRDSKVDLTTLGVVDLDTSVVPDVSPCF